MLEKMAVILIASFKYPMCQLEVRNVGFIEIGERRELSVVDGLVGGR